MKPVKCKLILHGRRREIELGEFPSLASCRRYIYATGLINYTIKKL